MNRFQQEFLGLMDEDHSNERIYKIIKIFNEYFPCEVIHIYKYSHFDGSYTGVFQYHPPNLTSMRHVQESMKVNKYLHEAVLKNEVRYFEGNRLQISIRSSDIAPVNIRDIFLLPISVNNIVIAYISAINVDFEVTQEVMDEANDFRHACSEVLTQADSNVKAEFTEKEITVIKFISFGYTTNEIAGIMNFSEPNIKYFVKNVMKKTDSKNRTEAVGKLFRLGILK